MGGYKSKIVLKKVAAVVVGSGFAQDILALIPCVALWRLPLCIVEFCIVIPPWQLSLNIIIWTFSVLTVNCVSFLVLIAYVCLELGLTPKWSSSRFWVSPYRKWPKLVLNRYCWSLWTTNCSCWFLGVFGKKTWDVGSYGPPKWLQKYFSAISISHLVYNTVQWCFLHAVTCDVRE